MKIEPTHLSGVVIIHPVVYQDSRGIFTETYQARSLSDIEGPEP